MLGILTVRVSVAAVPAAIDIGLPGVIEHGPENAPASQQAVTEPVQLGVQGYFGGLLRSRIRVGGERLADCELKTVRCEGDRGLLRE